MMPDEEKESNEESENQNPPGQGPVEKDPD